MLNQDTLLVKIGRNRSGESAGRIDMEVAVARVADLCDADFVELMETLCAAGDSCMTAWDNRDLGAVDATGSEHPCNVSGQDEALTSLGRWLPGGLLGDEMAIFVVGDIVGCQTDKKDVWERGRITRKVSLGLDWLFPPIYMVNFDNGGTWPCLETWLRREE